MIEEAAIASSKQLADDEEQPVHCTRQPYISIVAGSTPAAPQYLTTTEVRRRRRCSGAQLNSNPSPKELRYVRRHYHAWLRIPLLAALSKHAA